MQYRNIYTALQNCRVAEISDLLIVDSVFSNIFANRSILLLHQGPAISAFFSTDTIFWPTIGYELWFWASLLYCLDAYLFALVCVLMSWLEAKLAQTGIIRPEISDQSQTCSMILRQQSNPSLHIIKFLRSMFWSKWELPLLKEQVHNLFT